MVPKFISHLSYWADRADLSPTLTKAHHGTKQGTIQSICFMLVVFQFPPVTCANLFCLEHHGGPSASKPNFALSFLFSEFSALPPLNNQHHANNTSTGRGPYRRIMFFFGYLIWSSCIKLPRFWIHAGFCNQMHTSLRHPSPFTHRTHSKCKAAGMLRINIPEVWVQPWWHIGSCIPCRHW